MFLFLENYKPNNMIFDNNKLIPFYTFGNKPLINYINNINNYT